MFWTLSVYIFWAKLSSARFIEFLRYCWPIFHVLACLTIWKRLSSYCWHHAPFDSSPCFCWDCGPDLVICGQWRNLWQYFWLEAASWLYQAVLLSSPLFKATLHRWFPDSWAVFRFSCRIIMGIHVFLCNRRCSAMLWADDIFQLYFFFAVFGHSSLSFSFWFFFFW